MLSSTMADVSLYGITLIAFVAVVLPGCASAPARAATAAQAPAATSCPHLLVINRSLPTVQTWKRDDGQRVNVVPSGSFAPATIASSITATVEGGGRVALDMAGTLWSAGSNMNTSAPVVRLLGVAGRPLNWSRVPIKIDRAVIRRPDGTTTDVSADGWVVDAEDEMNDARSTLGAIRDANGQPEPVAVIEKGRQVVVMLASDIALL
jgi:hypothetical protein